MQNKLTLELLDKIKILEEKLASLEKNSIKKVTKKNKPPIYQFSAINHKILHNLVKIQQKMPRNIFTDWFNYQHDFNQETLDFLQHLISENQYLIKKYCEDDLKMNVLSPFLNAIHFRNINKNIREFYHGKLTYKTKHFTFNGHCDFYVSKGVFTPEKPYFFIQESKQDENNSQPLYPLLAEMISAVELNHFDSIKGAYIVGAIWNFVILEKIKKHQYKYYISQDFNSMNLNDLKMIYKNLLFIKSEIMMLIDQENNS